MYQLNAAVSDGQAQVAGQNMEHEKIISATDIDWGFELTKYVGRFFEGWQVKAVVAGAFAATCDFLGINPTLAMLAVALLGFECVLRIAAYYKRGRKRLCRGLQKGVARLLYYMVAVVVSAFAQATLLHSYHIDLPVTDWILGWLMLTDISAIISFLYILGYNIPTPLKHFINTTKCEIGRKIEETPSKIANVMDEGRKQ